MNMNELNHLKLQLKLVGDAASSTSEQLISFSNSLGRHLPTNPTVHELREKTKSLVEQEARYPSQYIDQLSQRLQAPTPNQLALLLSPKQTHMISSEKTVNALHQVNFRQFLTSYLHATKTIDSHGCTYRDSQLSKKLALQRMNSKKADDIVIHDLPNMTVAKINPYVNFLNTVELSTDNAGYLQQLDEDEFVLVVCDFANQTGLIDGEHYPFLYKSISAFINEHNKLHNILRDNLIDDLSHSHEKQRFTHLYIENEDSSLMRHFTNGEEKTLESPNKAYGKTTFEHFPFSVIGDRLILSNKCIMADGVPVGLNRLQSLKAENGDTLIGSKVVLIGSDGSEVLCEIFGEKCHGSTICLYTSMFDHKRNI
ncbi:hypothetical protein [Vibrio harveyi]|uniref:hypothetical protein n=1 Tax=Vibrio harveyi TaxID=669 RepID=UPI00041BB0D4|nr:hypothetical protein [Vibrio harveyi]